MTQDVKTTTKKLRSELKTAFKNCKFSVTINKYSMGQSINISWDNGASSADVEALINRVEEDYKAQKIEIRNERSTFIFTHRKVTNENKEAVKLSVLKELFDTPIEGLEDWDFSRMVNNRLAATTFF